MTDKELVDMLRVGGEVDLRQAADRIEQLNKENKRLADKCDMLDSENDTVQWILDTRGCRLLVLCPQCEKSLNAVFHKVELKESEEKDG